MWYGLASELGRGLWLANAASVAYRYRDPTNCAELAELRGYTWTRASRPAVSVIKACHCFDYQACEVPDWGTSWAKAAVEAIEAIAIRALPGYEAAPWGEG